MVTHPVMKKYKKSYFQKISNFCQILLNLLPVFSFNALMKNKIERDRCSFNFIWQSI